MVEENLKGQLMEKPLNLCRSGGGKSEDLAQAPSPERYVEEEQFENAW